jgi:predicted permease
MRSAERSQDLSVHVALGASRSRVARLLIAESLSLTTIGGAGGVALGALLLELYRALGPALPRLAEVAVDFRTIALASGVVLASGLLFGTLPLLFDGAGKGGRVLTQARGTSASRGQQWMRQGLVALEFALALPLLVAAGLLINSLYQLQRVDPGFDASHLLTARLRLLETNHPDTVQRIAFWNRTLAELRAVPGVGAVALAGEVPPSCGCYNNFDLVGRPAAHGNQPQSPWVAVTQDYFATVGVRVLDGRGFDDGRDTPDSPPVLVVTASWAQRYFPGESAVGKRLYEGGETSRQVEIVGVVGDVRFDGLQTAGETVFAPISQGWRNNPIYLHVRTGPEPLALVEPSRAVLQRLDPTLVPAEVTTMESLLADSLGNHRHWTAVIAVFALSALALAAIGVFGVLAYYVSRQHREIGVRVALGADRRRVIRMVMQRGIVCALAGTTVGVVLAIYLTTGLEALLFEVDRLDPVNLLGAGALLLAIAAAACWLPARRAAGIDPIAALRHE